MRWFFDTLLTEGNFATLLWVLVPVSLLLGLLGGLAWGRKSGAMLLAVARGGLLGLCGLVAVLLWQVYNYSASRYGLDTTKHFLMSLAFFVTCGVGLGIGGRRLSDWLEQRLSGEKIPSVIVEIDLDLEEDELG